MQHKQDLFAALCMNPYTLQSPLGAQLLSPGFRLVIFVLVTPVLHHFTSPLYSCYIKRNFRRCHAVWLFPSFAFGSLFFVAGPLFVAKICCHCVLCYP
jgi:hypothetical protein